MGKGEERKGRRPLYASWKGSFSGFEILDRGDS